MKRQIISAFLVILIALGGFFYYDMVNQESQKEAYKYTKDVAQVQFNNITYSIEEEATKFLLIQDLINTVDNTSDKIKLLNEAKSINEEFKNFSLYDTKGNLLLEKGIGTTKNYIDERGYKEALRGDFGLIYDTLEGKRRLDIFCPIRNNNAVIDYILVFSYFDEEIDTLLFSTIDEGSTLFDDTHNMIIDTSNNIISSLSSSEIEVFDNQIRAAEIIRDIKHNKSGQFIFHNEDTDSKYTIFYQPIYNNEFGLMTAVPYQNILRQHSRMFDSFAIYLAFSISSIIFIGVMLNHSYKDKIDIDKLTGILNKQGFEKKCKKALKAGKGILIIVDVDNFKKVNDNYGHLEGDLILKEIASSLVSSFRSNDLIARFGGDEFVLFISKQLSVPVVQRRLYFINENVKDIAEDYIKAPISLSFGIQYTEKGDSYTKVFDQADHKLYVSKENGKDQMIF